MKKITSLLVTCVLLIGLFVIKNSGFDFDNILSGNKAENIKTSEEDKSLINIQYNKNKYPENFVILNNNQTQLNQRDKRLLNQKGKNKSWQEYQSIDNLGRGQKVTALVDKKVVTQRSSKYLKEHGILYGGEKIYQRPSFPSYVHVSGEYKNGWFDKGKQRWKGYKSNNGNVDLGTYKGWLYNKSHTLAWSLGGDMETHNVTLGTRSQNVGSGQDGGMGYTESKVREAVQKNEKAKIYYESEPIYNNSELVPRGTHVTAYSVNDKGKTLNLNVWVFNKQKGIDINYKTGEWSAS